MQEGYDAAHELELASRWWDLRIEIGMWAREQRLLGKEDYGDPWRSLFLTKDVTPMSYLSYDEESIEYVDLVVAARARLLSSYAEAESREPGPRLGAPRVLLVDCPASLNMGLSAWLTGEFLDTDDIPPLDTWLKLVSSPDVQSIWPLASAIPFEAIGLIERAIVEGDPYDVLCWADEAGDRKVLQQRDKDVAKWRRVPVPEAWRRRG